MVLVAKQIWLHVSCSADTVACLEPVDSQRVSLVLPQEGTGQAGRSASLIIQRMSPTGRFSCKMKRCTRKGQRENAAYSRANDEWSAVFICFASCNGHPDEHVAESPGAKRKYKM